MGVGKDGGFYWKKAGNSQGYPAWLKAKLPPAEVGEEFMNHSLTVFAEQIVKVPLRVVRHIGL